MEQVYNKSSSISVTIMGRYFTEILFNNYITTVSVYWGVKKKFNFSKTSKKNVKLKTYACFY